jgi:DNA-binding response OmpR family regulator
MLILDLAMPCLDGSSVLSELRSHPETKDTPVIVVTGSDWVRTLATAVAVLHKPVTPSSSCRSSRATCRSSDRGNTPKSRNVEISFLERPPDERQIHRAVSTGGLPGGTFRRRLILGG